MKENGQFRHEFKYLCSELQLQMLESRLKGIMQTDAHAGADGSYTIRSLYFDDLEDRCYYENENGVDRRSKYRIRIYNGSDQYIHLEKKSKLRGMNQKEGCRITREQCLALMHNQIDMSVFDTYPPLLQEFILQIKTKGMAPKVIVEYDRKPYVYAIGNVRVTLDRNIRSSSDVMSFLEPNLYGRQIMPQGRQLLEVKYDALLPDHIYRTVQMKDLSRTSFSKYYLCRKYCRL